MSDDPGGYEAIRQAIRASRLPYVAKVSLLASVDMCLSGDFLVSVAIRERKDAGDYPTAARLLEMSGHYEAAGLAARGLT